MFLRLSSFQLSGIIILVFSKQKGLTLVFRNDPVDSVRVSSTFDSIPAIQRFLQAEIEGLLRDLMREEVPAIIHKLSLEWAMRHQADECLSPASLTNTQTDSPNSVHYYPSFDMDANDPLRPVFSAANLERLSALSLAQHTLSPFTASISQSVFRSSTSLIASLRQSSMKRHETPLLKAPDPDSFHRPHEISPPESVHSAQSADTRPSLYGRRQRASYLRRYPPKRKVVRLHPRTESETNSIAPSDASEGADYFSEPGGYKSAFQDFRQWSGKEPVMHNALWTSNPFPKTWDEDVEQTESGWGADPRFNMSVAKGRMDV